MGAKFVGWEVVSGTIEIVENDGVYSFVMGNEAVKIVAKYETLEGCSSIVSLSAGILATMTLAGVMFTKKKRK